MNRRKIDDIKKFKIVVLKYCLEVHQKRQEAILNSGHQSRRNDARQVKYTLMSQSEPGKSSMPKV